MVRAVAFLKYINVPCQFDLLGMVVCDIYLPRRMDDLCTNFIRCSYVVTCAPAVLRASIVFGGVCVCVCSSVCPHKILKTTDQKLMSLGTNMPHGER